MDIATEDKSLSRLTNPGPDDQLREMLRGKDFEDYKSPLFIAWQLNSACNLGCLHCCEEAGHKWRHRAFLRPNTHANAQLEVEQ